MKMTMITRNAGVLRMCIPAILAMAFVSQSGCNYFIPIAYLIGGPPSIEPDFDKMTNHSMTEKDAVVAVVVYAPQEVKWSHPKIDQELTRYVSFRLTENHIKTINPDRISAWLDTHENDWDRPEEIGKAFNTTYVIYIDLSKFSLFEEGSTTLFRGRSECYLSVYKMDSDGLGENIYSKEVISQYPIRAPRSTSEMTLTNFKRSYLSRLSEEIGWIFYEHYNGDEIGHAT